METVDEPTLISLFLAPYSGKTLDRYYRVLFEWWAWCIDARVMITGADRVLIEQWARCLRSRDLKKATISGHLALVCRFYRWCFEEGHMSRNIGAFVRIPSRPRRSNLRWLTKNQLDAVLTASKTAGYPWDLLFHLLGLNGLRLGETLSAKIEHLEHVDGQRVLLLPNRKGGVLDRLTLPPATLALIDEHVSRERGWLLTEGRGPLAPHRVYKACDEISDATGLDFHIRPHMLRATFVTLSLDAGVPARDVMASTGHAHTEMVAYYDRAHASLRRNAAPRLEKYLQEN
ncbi:tyrosine-type recombinase/integrase [Actinotignum sp. GS-2025b]|uniref:tyrosine-type recombinase/integrase n=2 Tax=Actinotignum TaxID=1653174 RepID=UPI003F47BE6A